METEPLKISQNQPKLQLNNQNITHYYIVCYVNDTLQMLLQYVICCDDFVFSFLFLELSVLTIAV